ncbi:MAG: zinc ribbon domain-containing protein [Subdoligranulum sp.]|nr:zinc ribbon domain-containing protein [Subdoligranulum sp.]
MKQRFFSLFACAALLLSIVSSAHTAWADSSSGDGDTYTDPETGATFVVPDGWEEDEFNRDGATGFFQAKFVSLNDPGSTLLYGSNDLWNELTTSERSGLNRSEIDSAYLYMDKSFLKSFADLAAQQGIQTSDNAIQLVTYGKNKCMELSGVLNIIGYDVPVTMTWYIESGCAYIFMVSATGDQVGKDFRSVLYSLQVPETDTPSEQNASSPTLSELLLNDGLHPLTLLLNLLLTFSVYTLPILFYRFVLNSGPSEKKSARAIVIFYGICAYLLVCWIMWLLDGRAGVSILFWSFVNYRILISGKKPEPDPADMLTEHPDRLPPATQPPAPSAPATPTPAAYVPAASAPAPSAPAAYVPAASAPAPSAPAAYIPAASAPAPSAPAAYPSAPPAPQPAAPAPQALPQTPPTDQNSSSGGAPAPAAPLWPAQYSHAQDVRVGFAKSRSDRRAPVYTDTPYVPAASTPAASAPAAYAPAASKPVSPTPQAAPMTAAAPAAPAPAAYTPTQAPHTAAPTAPFIPEPTIPAAYPPAPPAPQTPPSPATPVPATPHAPPSSAVPQASAFAPRIQFCRNCGFQLLEDSKFCSSCGTPVVPVSEGQNP